MNIESETGTSDQLDVPDTSETIHENQSNNAVSYTHLTLPTSDLV